MFYSELTELDIESVKRGSRIVLNAEIQGARISVPLQRDRRENLEGSQGRERTVPFAKVSSLRDSICACAVPATYVAGFRLAPLRG